MQCPKCGATIPEGSLYCEKCGEDIHVVPDYDPLLDVKLGLEVTEEAAHNGNSVSRDLFPKGNGIPNRPGTATKGKKNSRVKLYVLRGILILLAIVILGLSYVTQRNVKRHDSLDYQLEQAEKARGVGDYSKAIECYSRAIELDGEDVGLLENLASMYFLKNDQAWYEATLRRIQTHPEASREQIRSAIEKMIPLLIKKGDFNGISNLILQSEDEMLYADYKKYLSPKPELSLPDGSYDEIQSLQILVDPESEGTIYYTLDGSTPGENGQVYGLPILLEEGKTTVRACFVNAYGVKSEITTGTYAIGKN